MADYTNIQMTDEEIAIAINKCYTQHGELAKQATIALLEQNTHAITTLFKASLGIKPIHKYAAGDKVLVRKVQLPSWSCNEEKMVQEGLIFPNADNSDFLYNAEITKIKEWGEYPYALKFTIINKDGEHQKETGSIKEEYISGYQEEWPGE